MLALHLEGIILLVIGVIQLHSVAEFVMLMLTITLSLKEFCNVIRKSQPFYIQIPVLSFISISIPITLQQVVRWTKATNDTWFLQVSS